MNKTIEIKTADGCYETRLSDIIFFESEKNYLIAHLIGNKVYRGDSTMYQDIIMNTSSYVHPIILLLIMAL